MKKLEHIVSKNVRGNHHGYQQWVDDKLFFRAYVSNGNVVGYSERHGRDGSSWYSKSATIFIIR